MMDWVWIIHVILVKVYLPLVDIARFAVYIEVASQP